MKPIKHFRKKPKIMEENQNANFGRKPQPLVNNYRKPFVNNYRTVSQLTSCRNIFEELIIWQCF